MDNQKKLLETKFELLSSYPPELIARFNSFITTEFDDSLTVEMQLRSIIKWASKNFLVVDDLIIFINDLTNFLKAFMNQFDTQLEETMISILTEWQESGKLDVVISEALQWELDAFKERTEQNLQQTNKANTHDVRPTGHNTMSAVSFISDDGPLEDFLLLKPYSVAYGIPFSLALTGQTTLTDEHIKEAYSLGWDFGSHGMSHIDMATASYAEIDYHMKESKRVLTERGVHTDYFVYPHNSHGATARKLARKYYKFALAGVGIPVKYPAQTYIIERVEIPSIAGQDTLDYYKQMFDLAVAENKWIIFFMHANANVFDDTQKENLHQLIQYIQATQVPIVNVTDGYRMFGNAFSTPDVDEFDAFRVTNKGDIVGKSGNANAVQIGIDAKTTGSLGTTLGNGAIASGTQAVGIGYRSTAKGDFSSTIGANAYAEDQSVAFGTMSKANGTYSTALGSSTTTTGTQATTVGYSSSAVGEHASALGASANAVGDRSVSIGNRSNSNAGNAIAIGFLAKATLSSSIAIGDNTVSSGLYGVAIGSGAKATAQNTVAIGRNAIAETEGDFVLGSTFNRVIIPSNKLHLKSPNGTRYYIHITDGGVISATVG